jgi:hypothetical protein
MCTRSCLFNARSNSVSQKVGLYFFYFLTLIFHFMLDPEQGLYFYVEQINLILKLTRSQL